MSFGDWFNQISSRRHHSKTLYQLMRAMGVLGIIFGIGVAGFYVIGGGNYTLVECAFMTTITLTTVGYGEVIPVSGNPHAEVFVMILIVLGMGAFLYFVSTLTAFLVEGELLDMLLEKGLGPQDLEHEGPRHRRGLGNTGSHVFPEIAASNRQCVVIDREVRAILALFDATGKETPFIEGDATDDATLVKAGIERAGGLVLSLGNDRDNLFATISARRLNPHAFIVTRGEDPRSEQKFIMAGATSVIYTNVLGGMRMAAEVLRPQVTTFLDLMLADHDHYRRVEELPVPAHSPLVGKKLRDVGVRKHSDALIIAVWEKADQDYHFNPGPDYIIPADSKLIVLTLIDDVPRLEKLIERGFI